MSEAARETRAVLRLSRERPSALAVATAALRRLVERSSGGGAGGGGVGKDPAPNPAAVEAYRKELAAAAADDPADWAPLARFTAALRLSRFECDLLLLAAAVQLDPGLLASLPGAAGGHPTFALALVLFDEALAPPPAASEASATSPPGGWGALSPGAPLHRYRLVSSEPGDFILRAPLRIDEVVFSYLIGATSSDPRMRDLVEAVPPPTYLPPTHQNVAGRMAALCLGTAIALAATDLAGINRGEVVRLWIFLACFLQIPAAYICRRLDSRAALLLVLGTTLLQTALSASMLAFLQP